MAGGVFATITGSIVSSTSATLIILFLIYAFQGVLAFIPYLIGLLFKFLYYPIELIGQTIYPVGSLVYIVYTGFIFGLVLKLIMDFFNHKN